MKISLENGVTLHYEIQGEGPTLLLLHGNGESGEVFYPLMDALQKDFTCYAIDSRGHGRSSHHGEFFHYEDLAEDIDLLIRALHLQDVSILGYSDGGIVGLLLAIKQKDYLKALIASGANLSPRDITPTWQEHIANLAEAHPDNSLIQLMVNEPNIPRQDLKKIQIPVLYTCGRDGDIMEPEAYEALARLTPQGDVYVYENAGHGEYVTHSTRLKPQVLAFLQ